MKRTLVALAAVAALGPAPAFAGHAGEASREQDAVVDMVTAPRSQRPWFSHYEVYGSRPADGVALREPATGSVARIVPYPEEERPRGNRDR